MCEGWRLQLHVRSKVKEPMAAPDGNFLLLEKDGVKKHTSLNKIYWQDDVFWEFGQDEGPTCLTCHGYVTKEEKVTFKSLKGGWCTRCFCNQMKDLLRLPEFSIWNWTRLPFSLHLTWAAHLPFSNIINTSVQASFHIASSSFLLLSPFFPLCLPTSKSGWPVRGVQ